MTKAIGYVRRSTDKQDESLEQQRARLDSFARSNGWELVTVFADDAISGSDMDRPGLSDLLRFARADSEAEFIITWDRNRLARPKDAIDGMLLERQLMETGKQVVYAATGKYAGNDFASGILGYIEHHQNGDYLRKLSRDTMRGTISRVERGLWPGGPIPFGYDRLILDGETAKRIVRDTGDGGQVILDPFSFEVIDELPKGKKYKKQDHEVCSLIPSDDGRVRAVERMFRDYAHGKPSRTIRDEINAAGFRTSRGSQFSLATIYPILENPAYIGQCVYNRRTLSKWHRHQNGKSVERQDEGVEKRDKKDWIIKDHAWPALVDLETFESVQKRRQESKQKNRQVSGNVIRSEYLLTGIMYCGVCGGSMTGFTKTSGKGIRTRYYCCSTHHNGHKDRCPQRYTVPAEKVEQFIIGTIREDLSRLRDDDKLHEYVAEELRRVTSGQEDSREEVAARLKHATEQLKQAGKHLFTLDADYAKEIGAYEEIGRMTEEKKALERRLLELDQIIPNLPEAEELRQRACAAFDDLERILSEATIEEKRDLIRTYVQKIKAEPDSQQVVINLYPALFSRVVAGAGFEPTTSGL